MKIPTTECAACKERNEQAVQDWEEDIARREYGLVTIKAERHFAERMALKTVLAGIVLALITANIALIQVFEWPPHYWLVGAVIGLIMAGIGAVWYTFAHLTMHAPHTKMEFKVT